MRTALRSLGRICTRTIRSVPAAKAVVLRQQQQSAKRFMHASRPCKATPPPMVNVSGVTMERYHELSDATMDDLLESLERLIDEVGNPEYEVEYSATQQAIQSGVLTLHLGTLGTYVINKQPPNKQIWLSSPYSGPKRYDYIQEADGWYYSRDGRSMGDLLNEELSKVLDRNVNLGLVKVSDKIS